MGSVTSYTAPKIEELIRTAVDEATGRGEVTRDEMDNAINVHDDSPSSHAPIYNAIVEHDESDFAHPGKFARNPSEDLIRYVSLGGQDVNDGLTRGQPLRWAQTAIDDLAALGGGEVHVGNGVHEHEWAIASNVSVIGRGKRVTTFKAVPGSTRPGVITLEPGQIISNNLRNFEVIGSGNAGQHGIYLKGVGRDVSPFDGGMWNSEFKHLIVWQFDGEAIWFHAAGSGLIPHQFIDLVALEVYASGNRRALRLSGQVGQMQVLGGIYDGQGRGLGSENILVQRVVNDDGSNAGDIAPYEISFQGVTSQSAKRAATIERAYGVNFDKCYFEELHEGVDFGVSAYKGSVTRSKFAEVYKPDGTGYCVNAGVESRVSTTGNSYIGTIDRSTVANGGSITANDEYNTSGDYEGSGHTRQTAVSGSGVVAADSNRTLLVNASNINIVTITSQLSPGEVLFLKAHEGAIRFSTGGNISLGDRPTPVVVPSGAIVMLVRYDLSGVWQLLAIAERYIRSGEDEFSVDGPVFVGGRGGNGGGAPGDLQVNRGNGTAAIYFGNSNGLNFIFFNGTLFQLAKTLEVTGGVISKGSVAELSVEARTTGRKWSFYDSANNHLFLADGETGDVMAARRAGSLVDTETALMVMVNNAGVRTLRQVVVGPVDSGGAGYRSLRVAN